jgi:hypothetical protein
MAIGKLVGIWLISSYTADHERNEQAEEGVKAAEATYLSTCLALNALTVIKR